MARTGQIYGVSLGPGDPELITLKGLKCIQQADWVYYPGSLYRDGRKDSYSLKILKHYDLDENKLIGFYLKMSDDRSQAQKVYQDVFEAILEKYQNGDQIAIVSEGDISFYSSFAYLLEKMTVHQLKVKLISGVSSILLGAGEAQLPLALQNEKIAVLPRFGDIKELDLLLAQFETIILLKIRSVIGALLSYLKANEEKVTYIYSERLGTDEQYSANHWSEIEGRVVPYFALMILKRKDEN